MPFYTNLEVGPPLPVLLTQAERRYPPHRRFGQAGPLAFVHLGFSFNQRHFRIGIQLPEFAPHHFFTGCKSTLVINFS